MLTFVNLTGTDCPAVGNIAPLVDAGPDASVNLPSALLDGTVWDDFVTPVSVLWTEEPATRRRSPSATLRASIPR